MLVSWTLITILSVALPMPGARAECDKTVTRAIRKMWGDNPPSDILKQLEGRITYLYSITSDSESTTLKCAQTVLGKVQSERASAEDFYSLKTDKDNKQSSGSYMVVENDGVLINVIDPSLLDFIYVVYLQDDVMAYYQCRHDCDYLFPRCSYKPFVGITVHNHDPKDEKIKKAVAEAVKKLSTVGVPLPPNIGVDCETYV